MVIALQKKCTFFSQLTSSYIYFSILAGSGKTHTMMGETDRSDPDKYDLLKGIIPRALERMGQEKLVKEKIEAEERNKM
mgnify:CR=1 FL=1